MNLSKVKNIWGPSKTDKDKKKEEETFSYNEQRKGKAFHNPLSTATDSYYNQPKKL